AAENEGRDVCYEVVGVGPLEGGAGKAQRRLGGVGNGDVDELRLRRRRVDDRTQVGVGGQPTEYLVEQHTQCFGIDVAHYGYFEVVARHDPLLVSAQVIDGDRADAVGRAAFRHAVDVARIERLIECDVRLLRRRALTVADADQDRRTDAIERLRVEPRLAQ